MPAEDYVVRQKIGQGSFGMVNLCKCLVDRRLYVMKSIALQRLTPKQEENARLEAVLLSKLKHPNIVAHRETFYNADDTELFIIMQYCAKGDLHQHIKAQAKLGELFPEQLIMDWLLQIGLALQYLHGLNILHRDLKTQNVFLTSTGVIKLGDLGIARVLKSEEDMADTLVGTPYYMSPELFQGQPYNHKSDVWAFGCVAHELACLQRTFQANALAALASKVLQCEYEDISPTYSPELNVLIRSMLQDNADARPSVAEILANPFVGGHMSRFVSSAHGTAKSQSKTKSVSSASAVLQSPSSSSTSHPAQAQAQARPAPPANAEVSPAPGSTRVRRKKPPRAPAASESRTRASVPQPDAASGNLGSISSDSGLETVPRAPSRRQRRSRTTQPEIPAESPLPVYTSDSDLLTVSESETSDEED
eukprot:m.12843 g.12843  ORF g.12843 m.12843 type:complete len:421 (-) comp5872_c0_seq1:113-1375(-)